MYRVDFGNTSKKRLTVKTANKSWWKIKTCSSTYLLNRGLNKAIGSVRAAEVSRVARGPASSKCGSRQPSAPLSVVSGRRVARLPPPSLVNANADVFMYQETLISSDYIHGGTSTYARARALIKILHSAWGAQIKMSVGSGSQTKVVRGHDDNKK